MKNQKITSDEIGCTIVLCFALLYCIGIIEAKSTLLFGIVNFLNWIFNIRTQVAKYKKANKINRNTYQICIKQSRYLYISIKIIP